MSTPVASSAHFTANAYVGGSERAGAHREPVFNPARFDEVVGWVAEATPMDLDDAVRGAAEAGRHWAALGAGQRAELLRRAGDAVDVQRGELALLLTREQGKTLLEARSDVGGASLTLHYYAGLTDAIDEDALFRSDARGDVYVGRRPIGVTGVIVPWNSPVHLAFLGIAPALAAGNGVVVKPSNFAPLALTAVLRIVADILPPGLVATVPGSNDVGSAITEHPGIRKIFFTGSTATGKRIAAAAAGNLKRLSLELGGNDPAIVLDSAVVDDALVTELARGSFALSGQVCFGIKRIYVHRSRYAEVVAGLAEVTSRIVVGEGTRDRVSMGPVNNQAQFDRVTSLVHRAETDGAAVLLSGAVDDQDGWDSGYFLRPTIVTDIPASHPLVVEEQFGPVIPILSFDAEDEAIRQANATEFGLGSSVWSADVEHARAVARRIEAGSVFINAHRAGVSDVTMPFGGVKQSGLGRGHGQPALESCVETQVIADYSDLSGFPPSPIG